MLLLIMLNNLRQFWKVIDRTFSSSLTLTVFDRDEIARDVCYFLLSDVFSRSFSMPVTSCPDFPACVVVSFSQCIVLS